MNIASGIGPGILPGILPGLVALKASLGPHLPRRMQRVSSDMLFPWQGHSCSDE